MTDKKVTVGMRVESIEYIDRFPHFVLDTGLTGTVSLVEDDSIRVKMDQYIPGCESWDNEVSLYTEDMDSYNVDSMKEVFYIYFKEIPA